MIVKLQELGGCSGLSASIEFKADDCGDRSEYVLVLHSEQKLRAENLASNSVRLVVEGDLEIHDIADVIQKLTSTARNFKKEPENGS